MFYKIEKINWENKEEVEYWILDINWEIVFERDYLNEENKGKIPMIFFAKNTNNEIIWKIWLCYYDKIEEKDYFIENIDENEPWIYWFFVNDKHRNHWIWKKLMNEALLYCKENNFNYVCLDTYSAWEYYKKNWWFCFSHKIKWNDPSSEFLEIYYLDLKNA